MILVLEYLLVYSSTKFSSIISGYSSTTAVYTAVDRFIIINDPILQYLVILYSTPVLNLVVLVVL